MRFENGNFCLEVSYVATRLLVFSRAICTISLFLSARTLRRPRLEHVKEVVNIRLPVSSKTVIINSMCLARSSYHPHSVKAATVFEVAKQPQEPVVCDHPGAQSTQLSPRKLP